MFADFCNKYEDFYFTPEINSKKFFRLEESFFKIVIDQSYPEIIIKSLEKFLQFYRKEFNIEDSNIDELITKLNLFFSNNFYNSLFYDLIVCFNIVYYKKFLKWNDLISQKNLPVIQNGYYNCSKDIIDEIKTYLVKTIKSLESLKKEKSKIEWLINLSSFNEGNNPDKIQSFYISLGFKWDVDLADYFTLTYNLLDGILGKIKEIVQKD